MSDHGVDQWNRWVKALKEEALRLYHQEGYCSFKLGSVANYRLTSHILSPEEYCWEEYGIELSVLK